MGVWYRQTVNGDAGPTQLIAPVDPADTDADLLERKFASATAYGWEVERIGEDAFTATKRRWEAQDLCVREFWIE